MYPCDTRLVSHGPALLGYTMLVLTDWRLLVPTDRVSTNHMDTICPLCRSYTWCGKPCARAPNKPAEPVAVAKPAEIAKPAPIQPEAPEKAKKHGFDRAAYHKEYMREFMRKKRAAAKLS